MSRYISDRPECKAIFSYTRGRGQGGKVVLACNQATFKYFKSLNTFNPYYLYLYLPSPFKLCTTVKTLFLEPYTWLYSQLMYLSYWLLDNLYSFTSCWIYIKYLSSSDWHLKWEVSNARLILELIYSSISNTVLIPRIRRVQWTADTGRHFHKNLLSTVR